MRHPLQPIEKIDGINRFKKNKIVEFLLDAGHFDMNVLARMDFTDDDRTQFAQLIGYSVSGFGELNYVDDATFNAALAISEAEPDVTEDSIRTANAETKLEELKETLKPAVELLYNIGLD